MKNSEFQVVGGLYPFDQGYTGLVGRSKYSSVEEARAKSGFDYVLQFEDGREDGFFQNEVRPVKSEVSSKK